MSSDGLLLKPSRPMMAVDGYLLNVSIFTYPTVRVSMMITYLM